MLPCKLSSLLFAFVICSPIIAYSDTTENNPDAIQKAFEEFKPCIKIEKEVVVGQLQLLTISDFVSRSMLS